MKRGILPLVLPALVLAGVYLGFLVRTRLHERARLEEMQTIERERSGPIRERAARARLQLARARQEVVRLETQHAELVAAWHGPDQPLERLTRVFQAEDLAVVSSAPGESPREWTLHLRGGYANLTRALERLESADVPAIALGLTLEKDVDGAIKWVLQMWL